MSSINMPMQPKLFWISSAGPRDPGENRILDTLRDSGLKVIAGRVDQMTGHDPLPGDFLIVNTTAAQAPAALSIVALNRSKSIVIRCNEGDIAAGLPEQLGAQYVLDAREGPELTRSRILSFIGGRTTPPATEAMPEWRLPMIGESQAMQRVSEVIRLVGPRRCTVLITGETGTGKEVAARAIHNAGPRAAGPFVALNCSALPGSLLEAELFGHTRGAFTGATQARIGRFEQAAGGTLFLDEIGDLPLELQAKLLRVLQEREIQKLGSSETIKVDARIIAATNCDLRAKVQAGSFREDLYYRLNVVPLQLPPLRLRLSDVRQLAQHFLERICADEQIEAKLLTPQAWASLGSYEWPGNVRQLENAISSAVILSEGRRFLDVEDFSLDSVSRSPAGMEFGGAMALPDHGLDFEKTVNAIERDLLTQALRRTNGNKKAAAEMLCLKRTTLAAKVRVLDIQEGAA